MKSFFKKKKIDHKGIAEEAVRRWRVVVEQNPSDIKAGLKLFEATIALGDAELVSQTKSDLESKFPGDYDVKVAIARHYQSSAQYEIAEQKWLDILEENKQNPEALNALGYVNLNLKKPLVTMEYASRLQSMENSEKNGSKLMVNASFQLNDWEQALGHSEALLAMDPADKESVNSLISAYFKCQRYEEALQLISSEYSSDELSPKLLLTKQQLLMKMEQWEDSLKINMELCRQDEGNRDRLYDQAIILLKLGRLEESDAICSSVLDKDPMDVKFSTLSAQIGQAFVSSLKSA